MVRYSGEKTDHMKLHRHHIVLGALMGVLLSFSVTASVRVRLGELLVGYPNHSLD